MTDNYRLINSSHDVFLSRDVTNQTRFRIAFELKSPKVSDPNTIVAFEAYEDLLSLNRDILDDIYVMEIPGEPESRYVVMLLKEISASLGIKPKYIASKVTRVRAANNQWVGMKGEGIDLSTCGFEVSRSYEQLNCVESNLLAVYNADKGGFFVTYDFAVEDPKLKAMGLPIPKQITDMSALVMKKAFLRIKELKARQLQNIV